MFRRSLGLVLLLSGLVNSAGCGAFSPVRFDFSNRTVEKSPTHVIFFLDGAGGGGPIIDSGPVVEKGLRQAGFNGQYNGFTWQTGFGAIADECSSLAYKRARARVLAREIEQARIENPAAQIDVIAASAGTSVAVFGLEELRDDVSIDHLVLLSSALSSYYDLTRALQKVDQRAWSFSSDGDELLRALIPVLGSADRQFVGNAVGGVLGFTQPRQMTEEAKSAYSRLEHLEWSPEMVEFDHRGGHTDYKNVRFIASVIAPKLGIAKHDQRAELVQGE